MKKIAAIVFMAALVLAVWAAPTSSGRVAAPTASSKNHPPYFPGTRRWTQSTKFEYDDNGDLMGTVTTIKQITKPIDPDHDRLTYAREASNGTIRGNGLTAVWTRVCCTDDGRAPAPRPSSSPTDTAARR